MGLAGHEHPIALEISSLKSAVARFQDEAYNTSVKLQRRSLEIQRTHDRSIQLERENAALKGEIALLRANPDPDTSPQSHPATLQVQQLTLSLRHLSDKLSLSEESRSTLTTELAHAKSHALTVKRSADGAYALAAQTRSREEAGKIRERELEWKCKAAEEQVKMSDVVLQQYADLVRSLEASRPTLSHSPVTSTPVSPGHKDINPTNVHLQGISQLKKLQSEFQNEHARLLAQIDRLTTDLAAAQANCEIERSTSEMCRIDLGKANFELKKLQNDDNAAAKMVSRYMKFSQSSIDNLQRALIGLKARHSATVETLSLQLRTLSSQALISEAVAEKLRGALDELGGELMKETYGRRREVALRIRMTSREERVEEGLRRWIRRSEEALARLDEEDPNHQALFTMAQDARILLSSLDGPVTESTSVSGSLARLIAAQNATIDLEEELQLETARRLKLEILLAQGSYAIEDRERPRSPPPTETPHKIMNGQPQLHKHVSEEHTDGSVLRVPLSPSPPKIDMTSAQAVAAYPSTLSTIPGDIPDNISAEPSQDRLLGSRLPSHADHTMEQNALLINSDFCYPNSTSVTDPASLATEEIVKHLDHLDTHAQFIDPMSFSNEETTNFSSETGLVLERTQQELTSNSQREMSHSPPVSEDQSAAPHPLLEQLTKVSHRYDDVQRAFRDCYMALDALAPTITQNIPSNLSESTSHLMPTKFNGIPSDIFRGVLDRLTDFTEDVRVELDIQISDEGLLARGYETLLRVPGALSTSSNMRDTGHSNGEEHTPSQSEVEAQIESFISGDEPSIKKAQESFRKKLEDVQHDIAALKQAIHDPDFYASETSLPPNQTSDNDSNSNSWKSWINTPRSLTPSAGLAASPTFGDIMTTPRLRHSPSLNFHKRPSADTERKYPLAKLSLRVPMPEFPIYHNATSLRSASPQQRVRTVSTMYMVGLGARSSSGTYISMRGDPHKAFTSQGLKEIDGANTMPEAYKETDTDIEREIETDVE